MLSSPAFALLAVCSERQENSAREPQQYNTRRQLKSVYKLCTEKLQALALAQRRNSIFLPVGDLKVEIVG